MEITKDFRKQDVLKLNIPNLSLNDEDFVFKVHSDIERFLEYQPNCSVLLFPPVNNYRRFLIHETCDRFRSQYGLHTFSVGQGLKRRTVVCFQHQLTSHNNSLHRGTETRISNKNHFPRQSHTSASSFVATKEKQSSNATNMGVKKQNTESRFGKANELNLYRPPALRNAIEKLINENTTSKDITMATTTRTSTSATASISPSITAQQVVNSGQTENGDNKIATTTMTLMPNIMKSNKQQNTSTNNLLNTNTPDNPFNITKESTRASDMGVKQQAITRRERRPDRAVYIPRARRSQTTPPNTTGVSTTITTIATAATTTTTSTYSNSEHLVGRLSSHKSDEINNMCNSCDKNLEMNKSTTRTSSKSKMHARKIKNNNNKTTTSLINDIDKNMMIKKKSSHDDKETTLASPSAETSFLANGLNEKKMCAINKNINYNEFAMPANYHECLNKNYSGGINLSDGKKKCDCDKITTAANNNNNYNDFDINGYNSDNANNDDDDDEDNDDDNDEIQNKLIKSENATKITKTVVPIIKTKTTTTTASNASNKMININNESQTFNGGVRIEDVHAVNDKLIKNNNKKPLKADDIEEQELKRASKEINRSNRRIMKQTFASDVLEIPEKLPTTAKTTSVDAISDNCLPKTHETHINAKAIEHVVNDQIENDVGGGGGGGAADDWDSMYDESGECLDPKIVEEITDTLGKVKIDLPEMDYSMYLCNQSILEKESFPHVLEVSNFPAEFKHQDLLMIFSQYKESGFDIKWVDDTHALAVFSSARIAAEVLTMGHPFVVLKPLADATTESRLKAKKCATSLQPYRPRPATCAALARRLVTGALGVRLKTAAAERENEKLVLKQAKERKKMAEKQRDEIWES